jgi:hypothetical protein
MKVTHTTGPWTYEFGDIADENNDLVATVTLEKHEHGPLIAAAPELLAACKAALSICEHEAEQRGDYDTDDYEGGAAGPVAEMLRAAIAKAMGKA